MRGALNRPIFRLSFNYTGLLSRASMSYELSISQWHKLSSSYVIFKRILDNVIIVSILHMRND